MKKDLLIIANPIAGKGKTAAIEKDLQRSSLGEKYNVSIVRTLHRGHAADLAKQAAAEKIHCVVAAGGDGTVNECASSLAHTGTALAILPAGSGNGLARHLNYPLHPVAALNKISNAVAQPVDTYKVNNRFAVNVSGLGLDGMVAMKFDSSRRRGLFSYTVIGLREYIKYPSFRYTLTVDGSPAASSKAIMVVIANASQFGNAAVIAPHARLNDGLIDIITVRRPSLLKLPVLFLRLFRGTLKDDQYVTMIQCSTAKIACDHPVHLHIDGEPAFPARDIEVTIDVNSLLVMQ